VYFVPRKGSVQSTIIVCAAGPAVRADDFDATSIMTSHVGSGFGSMLFNTLRETYSYTYSPFSVLTRGRRYNRIACGAEVRSSVTDSALTVILRELRSLADEGPEEDALKRRIAVEVGQYRIAFERPSTVAAVLQNAWLNEVPIEDVANYTNRVENLTATDIQKAAERYLGMFNLRFVVVGSPDVRSKLESFGPIREFTLDRDDL
jgi:predicted Zn-dependent peptidase